MTPGRPSPFGSATRINAGRIWMLIVAAAVALASTGRAADVRPEFHPGRVVLKPRPGGNPQTLARFHAAQGASVHREFPRIEGIQVLRLPPGADVETVVRRYQQSGLVEFAEPDFRLRPAAAPNDPYYTSGGLWHFNNYGQGGGVADADIDAPEAWDALTAATNVIVAVLDTGIRYTHGDLAANMWVNPGEIPGNGLDDDANGFIDDVHGINAPANSGNPIDVIGHGTQVAGYIGAVGNNGLGVAGVAWRVKLMACRFYDDAGVGYITESVQALDYARENGAHIVNASFVNNVYSSALYSAINSCRAAGIIFVAAAGNDSNNNDANLIYPAAYNLDNIVAVAATTRYDGLASFSNYGATTVDLAAPGQDLISTFSSSDSAYLQNSGTSFSSPIVAGAFALMRARHPSANYRQLIDRMLAATDPVPALAGKCVTGGRLNLARALGPSVIADFTASSLGGNVPLTVRFTNTSFGAITSVWWNFGDGTTSTEQNPVHDFATEGNFTTSLTVNGSGATSTTNRAIVGVANYQMTNTTFAWIDPGAMPSLGLTGDAVSPGLPLPFAFRFYGQNYSTLYVGANGLAGFDGQSLVLAANTDLPNSAPPNNLLCPFWDDLNPISAGVRFGTVGTAPNRKVVISWVNVSAGGGGPPASFTFQVVLEETSNNLRFQYLEVEPGGRNGAAAGRAATVGLEHASGLVARKYSFNGSSLLANGQAILFSPPTTGSPANFIPTVAISSPAAEASFPAPASFTIVATASDGDGSVSQVEFFNGSTSLGIDTTSPYSVAVDSLAAGSYSFVAVATDNLGARATNSVNITVSNSPPQTVTLLNPRWDAGAFVFSFQSRAGSSYSVQFAPTLPTTNWQVLTNLVGTGAVIEVTNRNAGGSRYYRVESR